MSIQTIEYNQDFSQWLSQQAYLLKNKMIDKLDFDNLAEELEALGRSEHRELKSRMEVLIMHLLKWKYQSEKNGASWGKTILEQRIRIKGVLEDSPSLKNSLVDSEWLQKVWSNAVTEAMLETGLAKKTFPLEPEWTAEQILHSGFFPEHDSLTADIEKQNSPDTKKAKGHDR